MSTVKTLKNEKCNKLYYKNIPNQYRWVIYIRGRAINSSPVLITVKISRKKHPWQKFTRTKYAVRSQQNVSLKGDQNNLHYVTTFAKCIGGQLKCYSLLLSIMVKIFEYGEKTVSSASLESRRNDLKTGVLAHQNLPLRLDDFLETHILSIKDR